MENYDLPFTGVTHSAPSMHSAASRVVIFYGQIKKCSLLQMDSSNGQKRFGLQQSLFGNAAWNTDYFPSSCTKTNQSSHFSPSHSLQRPGPRQGWELCLCEIKTKHRDCSERIDNQWSFTRLPFESSAKIPMDFSKNLRFTCRSAWSKHTRLGCKKCFNPALCSKVALWIILPFFPSPLPHFPHL